MFELKLRALGRALALALVLAVFAAGAATAQSAKRVALVIGNSAYANVLQLANPRNDAADMAAKLQSLGFEVTSGTDLDLAAMRATVRDFIKNLDGTHLALMFYAGHGLQVNGVNYMVPIDAKLATQDDLEFEAMPMDIVLSAMERNAEVNLVFLDACRDNPLARNLARSMGTRSAAVGVGLARMGSGVGSLIAFSTQPGNVALDGQGRNSPFTAALLQHLGAPGEDITRELIRVRRDVIAATQGKQVPWDNSSLTGEVVLVPGEASQAGAGGSDSAERNALLKRIAELEAAQKAAEAAQSAAKQAQPQGDAASQAAPDSQEKTPGFDKSLLARLDPNVSAGAAEERNTAPSPEQIEEKLGLTKDDYKRVQSALNVLGYNAGAENGVFGPTARAELRKYQIRNRIEESGYLTEATLLALLKTIESVPRSYDGAWQLEFHRFNYGPSDPADINGRTLLAIADVELRNGEFFIKSKQIFTSDKNYFDTFKGTVSKDGNVSVRMRINTLFGKQQERDFSVGGTLPKLVPYGSIVSMKGSKLWTNEHAKGDEAWMRLDLRRVNG